MPTPSPNARVNNLMASLALNLSEETTTAMEDASGVSGTAALALLALEEFLGDAHVGRLAEVLGLTHSGAVRLVTQLETAGLAVRRPGLDRRRVEVRLTRQGRRRAAASRAARDDVIHQTTSVLSADETTLLEPLLNQLVIARVTARMERRRAGESGPWWCRSCDFTACGRPEGRCPAQAAAAGSPVARCRKAPRSAGGFPAPTSALTGLLAGRNRHEGGAHGHERGTQSDLVGHEEDTADREEDESDAVVGVHAEQIPGDVRAHARVATMLNTRGCRGNASA